MNNFLLALTVALAAASLALIGLVPSDGGPALLIAAPLVVGVAIAVAQLKIDDKFLVRLFVSAVMVRIFVGTLIYFLHLQGFFGGDANTFDTFGYALVKTWEGDLSYKYYVDLFTGGG